MAIELSKNYNPKDFEDRIYSFWLSNNLFAPKENRDNKRFTIVIPPPNVTSVLHMGHGLNNTIQDILIRYKRMQGYETLWIPGTDHAGIATQNVVEKELAKENKKRTDFTREKFVERVWQTALRHQKSIIEQLKKMGCSCDWDYNAFTLDEKRSLAVKKVFIDLFNNNLIYRSKYIVNWCPRCTTALADDEVNHSERNDKLWYIKYPIKESSEFIVVATTRPETMLGDTAVAFNDKDPRYSHLKGKVFILPLQNREIPAIFDSYVDPEFGTGAVKVTPAHDPADFEMAKRHSLPIINIMTDHGIMNENVAEKYQGLDRYECRKMIIEDLEKLGLILKIEDYKHSVGECYRCKTTIEPRYSDQWFVRMKPLAKEAIEVVKSGKIKFIPKRWVKVYFNWLENIKDWCISRQLWWGHRIPVYYCKKCDYYTASYNIPDICPKCSSKEFRQDEDVLDTWFSSCLWPFSTLGWPEESKDLKKFYPTSTLVTGPDIIFFWVARMIMVGLYFMKDVPFENVFFTGMVMDLHGRKMSKSLGNGIDPFEVIERHGADALRYTMVAIVSPNQNLKLGFPKEKNSNEIDSFEIGSRFANKIWNASRFILMNIPPDFKQKDINDIENLDVFDKWILTLLQRVIKNVNSYFDKARFNDIALSLNHFFWHDFCDWYLELSKLKIMYENEEIKKDKISLFLYVLKEFLKLMHPIMPFITEEIYNKLPDHSVSISIEKYPEYNSKLVYNKETKSVYKFIGMISLVRKIRSENNISLEKKIKIMIKTDDKDLLNFCRQKIKEILFLTKGEELIYGQNLTRPQNSSIGTNEKCEIYISLDNVIDKNKEVERLSKKYNKIKIDYDKTIARLNNNAFLGKAPKEVIEKEKDKLKEFESTLKKIEENLKILKN